MPVKIPVTGAAKPGADFILEQSFAEAMVESLQQQRTRYVANGDEEHVRKVDEQIAYYRSSDAPRTAGYEYVDIEPRTGGILRDSVIVGERGPEHVDLPPGNDHIVSTEPGCTHPDCVLMHPHAGPAILDADAAREAGLVQDRQSGAWRAPRPPGRRASE